VATGTSNSNKLWLNICFCVWRSREACTCFLSRCSFKL